MGWGTYRSYQANTLTKERNVKIEQLRGRIVHLDEVLTMSARMAVATGESRWEERYRRFEPQLEAAINEAIELAPESGSAEAAAHTDVANIALVNMENQAFDLVRAGRFEEARTILFGNEYRRQKRIYANGMEQFDACLEARARRISVGSELCVLAHRLCCRCPVDIARRLGGTPASFA
jgi:hypothetical protein